MNSSSSSTIRVSAPKSKTEKSEYSFSGPFKIGRDPECEVRLASTMVSRFHAEVRFSEGDWWLYDLKSTNGVLVEGRQVERVSLSENGRVELGRNGPVLSFAIEKPEQGRQERDAELSLDDYRKHYFEERPEGGIGSHTMMIRTIHKQLQKKQRRRFQVMIGVLACLLAGAGIYAAYSHVQLDKQKALAEDIFYAIKSLEIEFGDMLRAARDNKDAETLGYVAKYQARRAELEAKYDEFVKGLDIYGRGKSEEDRLILGIAHTFGECEISMPPEFSDEVKRYIGKWKATPRLAKAIEVAGKNDYTGKIAEAMSSHGLPRQFFYLGLQESNFNVGACGPPTKYGIAKGMWQFIPTTARNYGLHTGPLVEAPQMDTEDERCDFAKSTRAAAEYLRYIYDTEAQASGLLVMASYNWGENKVIKLIQTMPENPKDRNFWLLLSKYRSSIPQETYDYVFYIVSAAVIGENPRLFGFDFENPLGQFQKPQR